MKKIRECMGLVVTGLFFITAISAFDIFDKKTNLISLIRAAASLDPEVQSLGYGNGTVFARFPGKPVRKIYYFEGFYIARKIQTDTGFNSLSREIFVYRDLVTSEIISVWMNPFTEMPNEVFQVTNDPIDATQSYDDVRETILIPPDMVSFNMDIFLQFPNVLDPQNYTKYSAGPLYVGDELFQYYTNLTELATSTSPSVKMAGSWYRKGQFLPWMELGETPGCVFYHQTFWKLVNGFDDVAPDLLELVKSKYPKYLTAPTTFSGKMVSSWDVFKQVVDSRRASGEPDIQIPEVNIEKDLNVHKDKLDERIIKAATRSGDIKVYFNGTVNSEITGNNSVHLFNFDGHVQFKVLGVPDDTTIPISIDIMGEYRDPTTGEVLRSFMNPFKGVRQEVVPFNYSARQEVSLSSAFSYPLPGMDRLTILFDQSHTQMITGFEDWAMNMVNVFVDEAELTKDQPYFFGTWGRFTSWLPWFQMESFPGEMVWRTNFYKLA